MNGPQVLAIILPGAGIITWLLIRGLGVGVTTERSGK